MARSKPRLLDWLFGVGSALDVLPIARRPRAGLSGDWNLIARDLGASYRKQGSASGTATSGALTASEISPILSSHSVEQDKQSDLQEVIDDLVLRNWFQPIEAESILSAWNRLSESKLHRTNRFFILNSCLAASEAAATWESSSYNLSTLLRASDLICNAQEGAQTYTNLIGRPTDLVRRLGRRSLDHLTSSGLLDSEIRSYILVVAVKFEKSVAPECATQLYFHLEHLGFAESVWTSRTSELERIVDEVNNKADSLTGSRNILHARYSLNRMLLPALEAGDL